MSLWQFFFFKKKRKQDLISTSVASGMLNYLVVSGALPSSLSTATASFFIYFNINANTCNFDTKKHVHACAYENAIGWWRWLLRTRGISKPWQRSGTIAMYVCMNVCMYVCMYIYECIVVTYPNDVHCTAHPE